MYERRGSCARTAGPRHLELELSSPMILTTNGKMAIAGPGVAKPTP